MYLAEIEQEITMLEDQRVGPQAVVELAEVKQGEAAHAEALRQHAVRRAVYFGNGVGIATRSGELVQRRLQPSAVAAPRRVEHKE